MKTNKKTPAYTQEQIEQLKKSVFLSVEERSDIIVKMSESTGKTIHTIQQKVLRLKKQILGIPILKHRNKTEIFKIPTSVTLEIGGIKLTIPTNSITINGCLISW